MAGDSVASYSIKQRVHVFVFGFGDVVVAVAERDYFFGWDLVLVDQHIQPRSNGDHSVVLTGDEGYLFAAITDQPRQYVGLPTASAEVLDQFLMDKPESPFWIYEE